MKAVPKTNCVLLIDARERHVTRHAIELESITHEVKQMTTADYVVLAPNGNILAAIERKSLVDYAASLKDGRSDNKNKLIKLRNETGCRLIYIIEGPAYPDEKKYFGNIAYKNIESSMFHLMMNEGVVFIYTKDTLGTAKALGRFVRSMDTLVKKLDTDDAIGGTQQIDTPTLNQDQGASINTIAKASPLDKTELITKLTERHMKTDHEICRLLWSSFPGIAMETADDYSQTWTIADIVCGRISRTDIANFKLPHSGRKISKKVINSLTGISKLIEVRLLSNIEGISQATAKELTDITPLRKMLTYASAVIGMNKIGKARKSLGDEKAKRILRCFNYKYVRGADTRGADGIGLGVADTPGVRLGSSPKMSPPKLNCKTSLAISSESIATSINFEESVDMEVELPFELPDVSDADLDDILGIL
jgi:ERCC4-type nuclease